MRRLVLATTAGVILTGCTALTPSGPPRDDSPAQTDTTGYRLLHVPGIFEAEAAVQYVNTNADAVFFSRCMPDSEGPRFEIVREPPDTTTVFLGVLWTCVGGVEPGIVMPGDTLRFDVWLGSGESPNARPPVEMGERTGVFRVLIDLCWAPARNDEDCDPLPRELRRSNAFRVWPP